jgi:hypothetical protein
MGIQGIFFLFWGKFNTSAIHSARLLLLLLLMQLKMNNGRFRKERERASEFKAKHKIIDKLFFIHAHCSFARCS